MTFWMVCCVEATSTAETWILCPVRIQDRLPSLAEEIVGLKPDVIVAAAVNAAVPTHAATSEIPASANAKVDVVIARSITDL